MCLTVQLLLSEPYKPQQFSPGGRANNNVEPVPGLCTSADWQDLQRHRSLLCVSCSAVSKCPLLTGRMSNARW